MEDFIVYVLYHDDYSKAYAQLHYGDKPWTRLYKVSTQKYFESEFIVNVLPTLRDEWQEKKYIGVMTWKANQKVYVDFQMMQDRMQGGADIVVLGMFKPPHPSGHLLKWAEKCHPNFIELWEKMAEHLGYTPEIYKSETLPAFYYNYWLMKRDVLEMYFEVAKKAYTFLEEEQSIQEKLNQDSEYALEGPRENMTYLTYHCFLMERLPCLFSYAQKLKILPTIVKVN